MSIGFVHLSDIHFGQEKGGQIWVHEDVRESLIEDVGLAVRDLEAGRARGVIVTGDIAFGGRECEYDQAAKWLDRVADAAGCERTSIQVVPGNHDIDRSQITRATGMMLEKIATEGETALDEFLESEADRELLFRRFSAYRPFAEGYRCTLDTSAELSEERVATLAPGRSIRFIRLNSALVCSRHDEEGKLLLGARQRVMRERPGEELVVLCHHPLHWFRDSEDARRYVWNRARIFISGHEHRPGVRVESVDEGRDLMMLAAGAAIPPAAGDGYTYCYNLLEFKWEEARDGLSVRVWPREWADNLKRFSRGSGDMDGNGSEFFLACPNFRNAPAVEDGGAEEEEIECASETVQINVLNEPDAGAAEGPMSESYSLMLLRFFRDISSSQRLGILAALGALPPDLHGAVNETMERRAFDSLVKAGRSEELWNELNKTIDRKSGTE